MHPRMILTICRKDLFDAIRDMRVLMAIVMPLGIGVLYNVIFTSFDRKPSATVAIYAAGPTKLPETMRSLLGEVADIAFTTARSEDEVRELVRTKKAPLGLIVPPDFDAALTSGSRPTLVVVQRNESFDTNVGSSLVVRSLDRIVQQLAGQRPPAIISYDQIDTGQPAVFERLGLTRYFVLASVIMLIGFIAMLAIPTILAEETEKKTLDALVMAASYPDVIIAKALVGVVYTAVGVPLLLLITRLRPANLPLFVGSVALFSVTLIGFGLLLGGLFRNANQVNTWSGLFLLPVIGPAFATGYPLPDWVAFILAILPTSQAAKLSINAFSGETLFPQQWLAVLVIVAWGVVAYGLLLWRLSKREA
ncbi:MAG: ABC transporter permease [Thermomicrobiales bacterium]